MTELHVDLDALADLVAGQAPPEVEALVAACAGCTARRAELEAALAPGGPVAAALASLPTPPLPAEVAARLDAALAAERPAPSARSSTVVPLAAAPSRRTRSWLPALGGVAAAAALVVGALVLLPSGTERSADSTAAGAAPSRIATSSTGNDYGKDGKALQAALPALLDGKQASDAQAPESATTKATADSTTNALAVDALGALRDETTLAACLAALTDPGDEGIPLALDYASFQGQPALVVVLPTSKPEKVDVFVVGPECGPADAKVLFYTRLTKP